MRLIPLTQGKFAIVDDEDYNRLSKYKWCAQKRLNCNDYYAVRTITFKGLYDTDIGRLGKSRQVKVVMSRQIMGLCIDDSQVVDHINHNSLDNRKCNLRVCTFQQNVWNRQKRKPSRTSKYKGVRKIATKKATSKPWVVQFNSQYIGSYKTETEAASAYDAKAKELFGEYACTNF